MKTLLLTAIAGVLVFGTATVVPFCGIPPESSDAPANEQTDGAASPRAVTDEPTAPAASCEAGSYALPFGDAWMTEC
jgi:hypothetical protein